MKRFWHSWMAVAFSVAMIGPAVAQNGGSEIGSYQSILSRAGYQTTGQQVDANLLPPAQGSGTQMLPGASNTVMGTPIQQGAVVGNGCGVGNGYVDGNVGGMVSGDTSCGGDVVYEPGRSFGGRLQGISGGGNANTVVSLFGLVFIRDYEDDRQFSNNGAGAYLFTTDADNDSIGGVGVDLVRRNCNGRGWSLRYWGLYSNTASASLSPAPLYTDLTGLSGLTLAGPPIYTVDQIFDFGGVHTITRETDIQNIEFSVLNNGGSYTTRRGRSANYELFGGFRWFQFNEDFRYASTRDAAAPVGVPNEIYLNSETTNSLLGAQVGGRSEVCLTNRLRFSGSTRVGLFNNHIEANQNIRENGGPFAYVTGNAADLYNLDSEKDDVAFIAEFDAGLIFQVSQKARFNFGYRAVGVSGIALAVDQIPYNFSNTTQIRNIESNGDLMLHGGYAGFEFCY